MTGRFYMRSRSVCTCILPRCFDQRQGVLRTEDIVDKCQTIHNNTHLIKLNLNFKFPEPKMQGDWRWRPALRAHQNNSEKWGPALKAPPSRKCEEWRWSPTPGGVRNAAHMCAYKQTEKNTSTLSLSCTGYVRMGAMAPCTGHTTTAATLQKQMLLTR